MTDFALDSASVARYGIACVSIDWGGVCGKLPSRFWIGPVSFQILVFVLMALVAGACTSTQAVVNNKLRQILGEPTRAAAISFSIGTVFCWLYTIRNKSPWPDAQVLASQPWWIWTGGALGTVYIMTSIIVTRELGVAAMLALVIAGQMLMSMTLEHFGLLDAQVRSATPSRVIGTTLVVLGAFVMVYGKWLDEMWSANGK